MITKTSFKHGWYYHYRVHDSKVSKLAGEFPSLKSFLYDMFDNCPHNFFESGPRGSSLKFKIPGVDPVSLRGHEVSLLADQGLGVNAERFKSNHMKVQAFMLENDRNTVAMEVPIWLNPSELSCYGNVFGSDKPLTGHIDVLRIEDGRIWVWDYKPNAHLEKFAVTQTYFYALMLSNRTGIPLENFRCGYYDKFYAFVFRPEKDSIMANRQLCNFVKG